MRILPEVNQLQHVLPGMFWDRSKWIKMITKLKKNRWLNTKHDSDLWLRRVETLLAKAVLKDSKESSFLQAGVWNCYDSSIGMTGPPSNVAWKWCRISMDIDTYSRELCAALYIYIMIILHIHITYIHIWLYNDCTYDYLILYRLYIIVLCIFLCV